MTSNKKNGNSLEEKITETNKKILQTINNHLKTEGTIDYLKNTTKKDITIGSIKKFEHAPDNNILEVPLMFEIDGWNFEVGHYLLNEEGKILMPADKKLTRMYVEQNIKYVEKQKDTGLFQYVKKIRNFCKQTGYEQYKDFETAIENKTAKTEDVKYFLEENKKNFAEYPVDEFMEDVAHKLISLSIYPKILAFYNDEINEPKLNEILTTGIGLNTSSHYILNYLQLLEDLEKPATDKDFIIDEEKDRKEKKIRFEIETDFLTAVDAIRKNLQDLKYK